MRVVVALGGNALLKRGEPLTEEAQQRNVEEAAKSVAALARLHEVIVTHGNGPQVGLLALESAAYKDVPPYGLDVLGAESQGMIGFLLEQALRNQLPDRTIATLLTSVLVDRDDPALTRPTKFVGPVYSHVEAGALAATQGWTFGRDGEKLRRVVPSPDPRSILEIEAVRVLIEAGVLVICGGGGGVPVVRHDGRIEGVEGVVDKDLTSALLAERIHAERLLLLTDVSGVMRGWNTPRVQTIRQVAVSELRAAQLPAGSMGPKAEAACRFVEHTGKTAVIGALSDAAAMLAGEAGTVVVP